MSADHDKWHSDITENLSRGDVSQAKRTLTKRIKTLQASPARFAVILGYLDRNAVNEILILRQAGSTPQLKLIFDEETQRFWVRMSRGRKLVIGSIPRADSHVLDQFGDRAGKVYRPELMEVKRDRTGRIEYVAVELVQRDDASHNLVPYQEAIEQIIAAENPSDDK